MRFNGKGFDRVCAYTWEMSEDAGEGIPGTYYYIDADGNRRPCTQEEINSKCISYYDGKISHPFIYDEYILNEENIYKYLVQ